MRYQEFRKPNHIDCEVTGRLYYSSNAVHLSEDMLEVYLPARDILITCGWHPDGDPNGHYETQVHRMDELELLLPSLRASTIESAIEDVQKLVEQYGTNSDWLSISTTSETVIG